MNPLAALKEKMIIKPKVEDIERVAVVIKGVKRHRKNNKEKILLKRVLFLLIQ